MNNLKQTMPVSSERRMFTFLFVACAASATGLAQADAPLVAESDGQAASLGYRADASKVDKAKYPRFASGQQCANCTLYQGKAEAKSGPCSIFAGKQVAAIGWCSAYNKKA